MFTNTIIMSNKLRDYCKKTQFNSIQNILNRRKNEEEVILSNPLEKSTICHCHAYFVYCFSLAGILYLFCKYK